jgi:hypothetical protein
LRQAAGAFAFHGLNFAGSLPAFVVQGQGQAPMLGRRDIARRCLCGPVQGLLTGALLETDAGLVE